MKTQEKVTKAAVINRLLDKTVKATKRCLTMCELASNGGKK
ncbi:MAG: hypothetical protein ACOVQA_02420 [Thermoflexibacteraceae bacterium]|jgi:hypothetical protein